MLLRCKKCGYVWNYMGRSLYATCPHCAAKVKVEEIKAGTEEERCIRESILKQIATETAQRLETFGFSIDLKKLEELLREALEVSEV